MQPFLLHNVRSVIDGAEMMLDHSGWDGSLSSGKQEISEFR